MKLVSWNVNGIRALVRKDLLSPALETLKPDILCFQETKAERGQIEIDLPQYEEYWHSSARKKGYSGTAIFSKKEPESVRFGFPDDIRKRFKLVDEYGDPDAEGRVVAAEYPDFWLVNVYTPNAKPDLSRLVLRHKGWDPAFLAYCNALRRMKPVIFCGDLNVAHTPEDLANPKANEGEHGFTKEERAGIDRILDAGFVDSFRMFTEGNGHYSWWSNFGNARARNVGWRIDYFFVHESLISRIKGAKIHADIMGSDHCPVSLELK